MKTCKHITDTTNVNIARVEYKSNKYIHWNVNENITDPTNVNIARLNENLVNILQTQNINIGR